MYFARAISRLFQLCTLRTIKYQKKKEKMNKIADQKKKLLKS